MPKELELEKHNFVIPNLKKMIQAKVINDCGIIRGKNDKELY